MTTGGSIIRTVCGDIAPVAVGDANYHEHLFQTSPLLLGDELDDYEKSLREAQAVSDAGTTLMVEATPAGLGARPRDVARISRETGLHIVHVTGAHHSGHYRPGHPLLNEDEDALQRRFTRDIVEGFDESRSQPGRAVRAGMLKAGIRYWAIGTFERRSLSAVAASHRETGAPVMMHLDHGSAAFEVLDLLSADGVAEHRVVLAHMDRNLDPGLHLALASRGAYLGYDGWARHREAPDSSIIDCLSAVVENGGMSRIVLGGDVARCSRYVSYGGIPGLAYVQTRVLPRLRERIGVEGTAVVSRDNLISLLEFIPG